MRTDARLSSVYAPFQLAHRTQSQSPTSHDEDRETAANLSSDKKNKHRKSTDTRSSLRPGAGDNSSKQIDESRREGVGRRMRKDIPPPTSYPIVSHLPHHLMRWMTSHERNQAITTSQPFRHRCHPSPSITARGKQDSRLRHSHRSHEPPRPPCR